MIGYSSKCAGQFQVGSVSPKHRDRHDLHEEGHATQSDDEDDTRDGKRSSEHRQENNAGNGGEEIISPASYVTHSVLEV
jgi:hypothetical protein